MRGLGFRLGMLLSVAILPIGLISVMQTLNLSQAAERAAELALMGRTSSEAAGERTLLQSALGSAEALGPAVIETLDDPEACSRMMENFVERMRRSYVMEKKKKKKKKKTMGKGKGSGFYEEIVLIERLSFECVSVSVRGS